jgi:hypothetical protein
LQTAIVQERDLYCRIGGQYATEEALSLGAGGLGLVR